MTHSICESTRQALEQHLPKSVVVKTGLPTNKKLFPAEEAQIAGASTPRRHEYATGRSLAHRALIELGHPPRSIINHESLEPEWPQGIVGSISHCKAVVCVALSRSQNLNSIGIDVEMEGRLTSRSLKRILTEREYATLQKLDNQEQLAKATKIFSAKESIYKCTSSAWNTRLGFKDITIDLNSSDDTFSVRPESSNSQAMGWGKFEGRVKSSLGFVVSSAIIQN